MASGLYLVYGVLGFFNMSLGQLALVAGYTTWWCMHVLGLPFLVSLPLGVAVCALVTALSFELFIAPYYKHHRFLPIVTTIALSMILDGLILMLFHEEPRSIVVGRLEPFSAFGVVVTLQQLILIVCTIFFLAFLTRIIAKTSLGRKVRATVQHASAAESLGINAFILHRAVFITSGVLAGLAGVYQAIDQNITPVLGFSITIKAYAALIAGGRTSLWGTILCAYLIALLEQLAVGIPFFGHYIPAGYQSAVALAVIIVILLLRPQGLFSSSARIS